MSGKPQTTKAARAATSKKIAKKPHQGIRTRAGLVMSVNKIRRQQKRQTGQGIAKTSSIMQAAAVEYIVAELLELAGDVTLEKTQIGGPRKRIIPNDFARAIERDEELYQLLGNCEITDSSRRHFIHTRLLGKAAQKRLKENTGEAASKTPAASKPKARA